jgi:hypothetical protein
LAGELVSVLKSLAPAHETRCASKLAQATATDVIKFRRAAQARHRLGKNSWIHHASASD